MTIKVNHLNSTTYYPADDQNQWAATVPNGVKSGLGVTAHSPNNLSVDVAAGSGFYNGLFFFSDAVFNAPITSNASGYGRIDSVCADLDASTITVVAGTPSASPTPPVLTGNKLLLANVTVGNNVSSIVPGNVADMRADMLTINDCNGLSAVGGSGFYLCSSTTSNMPSAATGGGSLVHIGRNNNPSQLFMDFNSNIMYLRSYKSGAWTAWEAINSTTNSNWLFCGSDIAWSNSWANFSTYVTKAKRIAGVVYLEGHVTGGTTGTVAFTLPANMRPGQAINLDVTSSVVGQSARIYIGTNGSVEIDYPAGATWASLCGIAFVAVI